MKLNCKVCGKEFEKRDKPRRGKRGLKRKSIRSCHSITCSHQCSRENTINKQKLNKGKYYTPK